MNTPSTNTTNNHAAQAAAQRSHDRFGRSVARQLSEAAADLPYDVTERLRAARERALGQRRTVQKQVSESLSMSGNAAVLGGPEKPAGFWGRFATILPLLALVAGLIGIGVFQDEQWAQEVAEVDSELLTDDLPPAAYTDPGFAQFLRNNLGK